MPCFVYISVIIKINFNVYPPRAEPTRAIAPLLFSFFKLFSTAVVPMLTFSDKPLMVMR